jgi:hypothetical protein
MMARPGFAGHDEVLADFLHRTTDAGRTATDQLAND